MNAPGIDRNRCEGAGACMQICPKAVFEVHILNADQRKALSFMGRIRAWAHGGKQAFTVRADDCERCGLCVSACPEGAIYFDD